MGKAKTTEQFIEESKRVYGDKYDYSKTVYVSNKTKVIIICPIHGEFIQTPTGHLYGYGCPKCRSRYKRTRPRRLNTNEFIEKSKLIHGDKYDYSKVNYVNNRYKVIINCPIHGEFLQAPCKHLAGQGCKECGGIRTLNANLKTTKDFVERLRKVFGDIYDYSKVEYVKAKTKVCLICKKHGEFWARPDHLLNGHGCIKCRESGIEREMRNTLTENAINFIQEYHDVSVFNKQSLDFYIPSLNIGIECQGEQHFKDNFYKNKGNIDSKGVLKYVQELDEKKKKICKDNNIHLIYYVPSIFSKYMKDGDIYFTNINDLIKYIKEYKIITY